MNHLDSSRKMCSWISGIMAQSSYYIKLNTTGSSVGLQLVFMPHNSFFVWIPNVGILPVAQHTDSNYSYQNLGNYHGVSPGTQRPSVKSTWDKVQLILYFSWVLHLCSWAQWKFYASRICAHKSHGPLITSLVITISLTYNYITNGHWSTQEGWQED